MTHLNEQPHRRRTLLGRLLAVYLLVLVWAVLVLGRLLDLQVIRGDEYRALGDQQRAGFTDLGARRGEILDRTLDTLAINVQMDSVAADPKLIDEPLETARKLSPVLGRPVEEIHQRLLTDNRFVLLERALPPDRALNVSKLELDGVFLKKNSQRFYPGMSLASQVLGFVSVDNEGLSGLEYRYDEQIRGETSRVYLRFDARRKSYESVATNEETSGDVLVLNLDHTIQYIAERTLQKTMEDSRASDGSVVVMDPESGEILAMASYPPFNPNRFSDYGPEAYRNRAILEIYEPGSTFKIITMAAILNEGLADLSERIDCRVGTLRLAGKVYREATHSYGELSVAEVVAKSSNVGTIKLALRLGPERLHDYIKAFGFGDKTGVDLPGEQVGLFSPLAQWSKISIGALAIGQEIGVTALQMLRGVSAVANGGFLVQPYLVRQILSPEGDVVAQFEPRRERILKRETTEKLKTALALVVAEGTGKHARLNGYSSGGKTGTAQKFIDGRYSSTKYVASYVGFAPLNNPRLAVIVVINEPRNGYYGGAVAAPAFKEIMERSLIHLNVARDLPLDADLEVAEKRTPELEPEPAASVSNAEDSLPGANLEETVLSLLEEGGEANPGGTLTLDTDLLAVPDFTGLSLREVATRCARIGLALKVSGSGLAVGQRPEVGKRVSRGAVCEVFFSNQGQRAVGSSEIALKSSAVVGDSRDQ